MIKWFFIALVSVLLHGDEVTMSWNEDRKLNWNDFKDEPDPDVDAVALTASGITFGYSISKNETKVFDFKAIVHAHFYPEKSWYKPKTANTYILAHEQLHFDITELHARKFRKQIESLKANNGIKRKLDEIHKQINNDLSAMQNRYDKETDYSRKPEQQQKWYKFVLAELKKLEAYKSE